MKNNGDTHSIFDYIEIHTSTQGIWNNILFSDSAVD